MIRVWVLIPWGGAVQEPSPETTELRGQHDATTVDHIEHYYPAAELLEFLRRACLVILR